MIDLTRRTAQYDPAPLTSHATVLADLIGRSEPTDAIGNEVRIRAAANLVVECWHAGEWVVVHCHGGRGRPGTVLGTALVLMGHDATDVLAWLHRVQRTRGRRGWPEQPWQAEVVMRTVA